MKRYLLLLVLFIALIWLVMAREQSARQVQVQVVPTATPAPSATPTTMLSPAQIIETLTFGSTPRPDPPTPTPAPTPKQVFTWSSQSPDGRWIAEGKSEVPVQGDNSHKQVIVRRTDQSDGWAVMDETSHYGLSVTSPVPDHWSRDGKHFFFRDQGAADGCDLFGFWDLLRVNLVSGEVTKLMPNAVLSQDDQSLAYLSNEPTQQPPKLQIVVRDFETNRERTGAMTLVDFEPEAPQVGNIVWSPDNRWILFTVARHPCIFPQWSHTIVRVDVSNLTLTEMIRDDTRRFRIAAWQEPSKVWLMDFEQKQWWLNPFTGDVVQAK
ncbi:MAG: hypothetical protein LC737_10095 [Chloroflexi bacterium]|nr:hypothetical protein [Chloroflexota bacterium]